VVVKVFLTSTYRLHQAFPAAMPQLQRWLNLRLPDPLQQSGVVTC